MVILALINRIKERLAYLTTQRPEYKGHSHVMAWRERWKCVSPEEGSRCCLWAGDWRGIFSLDEEYHMIELGLGLAMAQARIKDSQQSSDTPLDTGLFPQLTLCRFGQCLA